MKRSWQSFWKARQPRERQALTLLAAVLLAALLVQLTWSAHVATTRLRLQVPKLQAQLATMHAQADEWQELSRQALPLPFDQERLRVEVDSSVKSLGDEVQLTWRGAGQLKVQGKVSHSAWIDWLAKLHSDYRLVVQSARVSAAGAGNVTVSAEISNRANTP